MGKAGIGPLSGLRATEVSVGGAVPWLMKHLTYHGAEVIRIESPSRPDMVRAYVSPLVPERGIQPSASPWFHEWHSGKRFISMNLSGPRSMELLGRLVAASDIVAANLGARATMKMGLTYEVLRRFNPSIIMLNPTGYGMTGPLKDYLAWGPQMEPISGISHFTAYPGGKPAGSPYAYPDWIAPLHGMVAVMSAIDYRNRTGKGHYIDLSMFESTVPVIGPLLLDYIANGTDSDGQGNWSPVAAPHGCYKCKATATSSGPSEHWCVIAVSTEEEWRAFCSVLGTPSWTGEERFSTLGTRLKNTAELDRLVEGWTSLHTAKSVMLKMQRAGVPAGVVETVPDMLYHDPQLKARRFFREYESLARGKVTGTGLAVRLAEPVTTALRTGIDVGSDNECVFKEVLGLTQGQVEGYIESGAIELPLATPAPPSELE